MNKICQNKIYTIIRLFTTMDRLPLIKLRPPKMKGYELMEKNGKFRNIPKKPKFKKKKDADSISNNEPSFDLKLIKKIIK